MADDNTSTYTTLLKEMIDGGFAINKINQGANITVAGYEMSAKAAIDGGNYSAGVYRDYGAAALAFSNYRKALSQNQYKRTVDTVATQLTDISSKNAAIQGASGLSLGSKSYLAVANSALSNTERQLLQMRNTELQKQQGITYEAQTEVTKLENQARNAEYTGQVSAINAQYKGEVASYEASSQNYNNISKGLTSAITLLNTTKKK